MFKRMILIFLIILLSACSSRYDRGYLGGTNQDQIETLTVFRDAARSAERGKYPGNCYYDSDIAADGSRCGARSAKSRPGGYD